jgi:5-methylcytosine-specific restriction protein A
VNNTLHIDHIVALANGGTNDIKNLQLLCVECHERKTKDELKHGYNNVDPITSSFCGHVWEIFRSDDMMKWAFTQEWTKIYNKKGDDVSKAASKYAYDIKRERKNVMYYSKYEWPVFTVMDKVQKYLAEGDVNKPLGCGYYYVVNDNLFPLRGVMVGIVSQW